MEGDLAKLRGLRRVYICHLENMVTDINNLIQDFDFRNEQHLVEIKTTFSCKIEPIKLLDNNILSLLKTEESENEFDEIVTRYVKNTRILTKIEHVLHKNQN